MNDTVNSEARPARRDTTLQAAGAEFLVLARLLFAQIPSFKAYTNHPGYDLIATDPEAGTSCRIQVKSRWGGSIDGFFIKNFDCDFVVLVASHLGSAGAYPGDGDPVVYVLPATVLRPLLRNAQTSPKIQLRDLPDREGYRDRWDLIKDHLRGGAR
jgi:hypothetical protein